MNLKEWAIKQAFGWRGDLVLEFVDAMSKPGQSIATITPIIVSIYSRWHR